MTDPNKILVGSEPCPACNSRDNLRRYADGHGYCFGCGHKEPPTDKASYVIPKGGVSLTSRSLPLLAGEVTGAPKRGLTLEACQAYGYSSGQLENGTPVQLANHFDEEGNIVAQKVRTPTKEFQVRGDKDKMHLYGMHMFQSGGNSIFIYEGEIDAISGYIMSGGRGVHVSLPNGAQTAVKSIQLDLEFVESFTRAYLVFDADEPGRKAQEAVAKLLTPGKAFIPKMPQGVKDANDLLVSGQAEAFLEMIKAARRYAPSGIVDKAELRKRILIPKVMSKVLYPWDGLNQFTKGIRGGEVVVVTAGIGVGKTTAVTQVISSLIASQTGKAGLMMMEDSIEDPILRMIGHRLEQAIHVERGDVSDEVVLEHYDAIEPWFETYDYSNEPDADEFLSKINFMVSALGCKYVVVDNLSVVVAGLEDKDERRMIDKLMKKLFAMAKRLDVCIFLVSHLRRVDGNKGHEDGAVTSMSQLRGSNSIGSNASIVVGLERDQQGENQNLVTVRVLKNRYAAKTGIACTLEYDIETGSLIQVGGAPEKAASKPVNDDF